MRVEHDERCTAALMMSGAMIWPAVIVVSAAAVAAASIWQVGLSIRPVTAFWFFLMCPGMAIVPLLPIQDRLIQLGVAIALSICLDGLVSEAMLASRTWSEPGALAILTGVCLIGTTLQVRRVIHRTARSYTAERRR